MRHINFLCIAFCLLLNVSTSYSSESEKPGPDNNYKSTPLKDFCTSPRTGLLKQLIQIFRTSPEIDGREKVGFLLDNFKKRDPSINDESIKEAFYYCQDKPKDNEKVINALYPHLKPPFRDDFLSKIKEKPTPMKEVIWKSDPPGGLIYPNWGILMDPNTYRDNKNFSFTLDKASKFIDKFNPNGEPLSLAEYILVPTSYVNNRSSKVRYSWKRITPYHDPKNALSFRLSSDHRGIPSAPSEQSWRNPLKSLCTSPLNQVERLAIAKLFSDKNFDDATIEEALRTCLLNKKYNASIIEILENKLAQKSSDSEFSE